MILFCLALCHPPCQNGKCVSKNTCSCNPGFTGKHWDKGMITFQAYRHR